MIYYNFRRENDFLDVQLVIITTKYCLSNLIISLITEVFYGILFYSQDGPFLVHLHFKYSKELLYTSQQFLYFCIELFFC